MAVVPFCITADAVASTSHNDQRNLARFLANHALVTDDAEEEILKSKEASCPELRAVILRLFDLNKFPKIPPVKEWTAKGIDPATQLFKYVCRTTTDDEISSSGYEVKGGVIEVGRFKYGPIVNLYSSYLDEFRTQFSAGVRARDDKNFRDQFSKDILRPLSCISGEVRIFDNYWSVDKDGSIWLLKQAVQNPLRLENRRVKVVTSGEPMGQPNSEERRRWRDRFERALRTGLKPVNFVINLEIEFLVVPREAARARNHERAIQFIQGGKKYRTVAFGDSSDIFDEHSNRGTTTWRLLFDQVLDKELDDLIHDWQRHPDVERIEFRLPDSH